jgi:branched-chain amino acid transport system permease protein
MNEFVQTLVDGLSLGSLYALLALGVALVFGVMGLVNFAYGELLMIGGYAFYVLGPPSWVLGAVVIVLLLVAVSVGMERIVFRPLRTADPATLLVASFALAYFLQSLAQLIFSSRSKSISVTPVFDDSIEILGVRVGNLDLISIAITAALFGGLVAFLRRSRVGVQMRAAAEDFLMAQLMGVRGNRVIAAAFAISGLFAGIASLLYIGQTGTLTPQLGVSPLLIAFVATVVGGMGTLLGSALGGLSLGLLSVLLQAYLPVELRPFRDAFVFAAVIGILLLRPQGLLAPRSLTARV